jgi:hypothetical protein
MTQEVLKLALEVLKDFADLIRYDEEYDEIGSHDCCGALSYNQHSESCKATKAIAAIKEAIAQLALDAKAENARELGLDYEPEPVAWMYVNTDGECEQIEYGEPFDDPSTTLLYTHPPQRTWVGLAKEDRLCAKYMQDAPDGIDAVIDYIESKLKELNI